jgi:hypothetical protein
MQPIASFPNLPKERHGEPSIVRYQMNILRFTDVFLNSRLYELLPMTPDGLTLSTPLQGEPPNFTVILVL